MMTTRALIVILIVMVSTIAGFALAADEPFDTTAAKHLEKGHAYLKARDYDAAISEFEKSAEIYPDAEAYYYLGYAHYLKGRSGNEESRTKSLENFEKAYEIDPNFTPNRAVAAEPAPPRPEGKAKEKSLSDAAPKP